MSTLEKAEKRSFAKKLHGVGTAATIRENVVKDLRENAVLVRWLVLYKFTSFRFCRKMHTFVATAGGFQPFSICSFGTYVY